MTLPILGDLSAMEQAVRTLHRNGRIQKASVRLVERRAANHRDTALRLGSAKMSAGYFKARDSLVSAILELDCVVNSMKSGPAKSPIGELATDLWRAMNPETESIQVFAAVGPSLQASPKCLSEKDDRQASLAILLPHRVYEGSPLAGLVAHEVAHSLSDVDERIGSCIPEMWARGEALADEFGQAALGPGFCWAVAYHLRRITNDGKEPLRQSHRHPAWAVRTESLEGLLADVWMGNDIQAWARRWLKRATSYAGALPPASVKPSVADCIGDARALIERIRTVKMDESVLRTLGKPGTVVSSMRPTLRFNSGCPR